MQPAGLGTRMGTRHSGTAWSAHCWVLYLWAAGNHRMARARGALAWVSVNFRKFSPCIARTRPARAGLTVHPPSRTLELLAFDEYCRFDTFAFFMRIKQASLYTHKESRIIKTAIFIES
jgi:hypothetical protein